MNTKIEHETEEEYCCGSEAKIPETMSIAFGFGTATCWQCGIKIAGWECACELEHECEEN